MKKGMCTCAPHAHRTVTKRGGCFSCCHWSPRTTPGTNWASSGLLFYSDGPSWWRSATQRCGDTPAFYPPSCSLPVSLHWVCSVLVGVPDRGGPPWWLCIALFAVRSTTSQLTRPAKLSARTRWGWGRQAASRLACSILHLSPDISHVRERKRSS